MCFVVFIKSMDSIAYDCETLKRKNGIKGRAQIDLYCFLFSQKKNLKTGHLFSVQVFVLL